MILTGIYVLAFVVFATGIFKKLEKALAAPSIWVVVAMVVSAASSPSVGTLKPAGQMSSLPNSSFEFGQENNNTIDATSYGKLTVKLPLGNKQKFTNFAIASKAFKGLGVCDWTWTHSR
jgi:hypothetical protein